MEASARVSDVERYLMLEAMYGERIPECRNCKSLDRMWIDHVNHLMICDMCDRKEGIENVRMVPKDPRLREMGFGSWTWDDSRQAWQGRT